MHLTSVTLYEDSLDARFCTDLLGHRPRLLSGDAQNFDRCRTEFYNVVRAQLEKVKSSATAAIRTLREYLATELPATGSEETMTIQQSIAAAGSVEREVTRTSKAGIKDGKRGGFQ